MDFESLKEQFLERFHFYKNQIQESEAYIQLKERYDNLTPQIQLLIKATSVFFIIYIFYSIPASFVASANENLSLFEEQRQLTRDLIRAGRIEKTTQLPPPAPSASDLSNQVDGILTREQILPEQKMSAAAKENVASKDLVPPSIKQSGIKVSLKKLNLRQIVKVGEALNNINSSRLMNIAIQADADDPHYFTVDYEVAAF